MQATTRREWWSIAAVSALWLAFLFRVAGQAVQRWFPLEFLPPFDAWQGSGIAYPALLASQVVIIALVGAALCSIVHGARALGTTASWCVIFIGCAYSP